MYDINSDGEDDYDDDDSDEDDANGKSAATRKVDYNRKSVKFKLEQRTADAKNDK